MESLSLLQVNDQVLITKIIAKGPDDKLLGLKPLEFTIVE